MKRAIVLVYLSVVLAFSSTCVFGQAGTEVLLEEGDKAFEFGDHEGSKLYYNLVIDENPNNVKAHFMMGRVYLLSASEKVKALSYFLKAEDLDPEVSDYLNYYIAEAYRFNNKFDDAIQYYEKFLSDLKAIGDDKSKRNIPRIKHKIKLCENAKNLIDRPVKVEIIDLGIHINSSQDEYAPVVSADENILIYTARRDDCSGDLKDNDNKKFEDLFYARKLNGQWEEAKNMGKVINEENKHKSSIGLSPDGHTLYVFDGTSGNGDIYECKFEEDNWSKPKPIKEINTKSFRETSICATHEGRIYFSSNRDGGRGSMDIYYIEINDKGKWGEVKNLGDQINTEVGEDSPYFDPNTNILYFSSEGHTSMGGYDIFKCQYNPDDDSWGIPVNLGYPINTSDDDLYFSLTSDGERAYYSSYKEEGQGGHDIFMLRFNQLETDTDHDLVDATLDTLPKEDTVIAEIDYKDVELFVNVVDFETNNNIQTKVDILDPVTGQKINLSTDESGELRYKFSNKETKTYEIFFEKSGYVFKSITVTIPGVTEEVQEVHKTISLKPVTSDETIGRVNVFRNIYFDFDKHTLKPVSFVEIDKLFKMMEDNPSISVEIAGHTDFVGSHEYNDQLSEQRANAVSRYLINKGIAPSRLSVKGYGESKPLASNEDFSELNRRTEFIIKK